MASFQFQTVGNIISGLGSIAELTQILKDKPYKKLLCTRQISQNPYPIRILPS